MGLGSSSSLERKSARADGSGSGSASSGLTSARDGEEDEHSGESSMNQLQFEQMEDEALADAEEAQAAKDEEKRIFKRKKSETEKARQ